MALVAVKLADALSRTEHHRPMPKEATENSGDESRELLRAAISLRLKEGKNSLDRLDAERRSRGNNLLGKSLEERIVWGELIDLELQEIDEEVRRICRTAGQMPETHISNHDTEEGQDERDHP